MLLRQTQLVYNKTDALIIHSQHAKHLFINNVYHNFHFQHRFPETLKELSTTISQGTHALQLL